MKIKRERREKEKREKKEKSKQGGSADRVGGSADERKFAMCLT